jgi:D-amino peptidase
MKDWLRILAASLLLLPAGAAAQRPLRVYISVDMEGIGGVGTSAMTSPAGKDYATARRLMTDEINAVVAAIFAGGPAAVLVNDSHGDHQNAIHTDLDPRVLYTQGALKPWGMVEGLDSTFDAVILLGAHARAGTPNGFLAHTGTGSVKGLWLNDIEVGEGELNAAFAGAMGVPVVLAAGDSVFAAQFAASVPALTVTTKVAVTPGAATLQHPEAVRRALAEATRRALDGVAAARPFVISEPVRVRLRLDDVTTPQLLEAIPGVRRADGYTVAFTAPTMREAYRLIRFMYRFVST